MMVSKSPCLLVVVMALTALGCGNDSARAAKENRRILEERRKVVLERGRAMYLDEHIGDVSLSGEVHDDKGAFLDGVTLKVSFSGLVGATERSTNTTVEIQFDKRFSWSRKNAGLITCVFSKDGYYPATFRTAVSRDGVRDATRRKKLEKADIRIVLQKKGEMTELTAYQYVLTSEASGRSRVMDLTRKPGYHRQTVANIRDADLHPKKGVYLKLLNSKDGVSTNSLKGALAAFGEDDGFLFAGTDDGEIDPDLLLRKMTKAPEDGYGRELPLLKNGKVLLFYCRIGEQYGKGYVLQLQSRAKDLPPKASTVVFLQPDGSRNLEAVTHRW